MLKADLYFIPHLGSRIMDRMCQKAIAGMNKTASWIIALAVCPLALPLTDVLPDLEQPPQRQNRPEHSPAPVAPPRTVAHGHHPPDQGGIAVRVEKIFLRVGKSEARQA